MDPAADAGECGLLGPISRWVEHSHRALIPGAITCSNSESRCLSYGDIAAVVACLLPDDRVCLARPPCLAAARSISPPQLEWDHHAPSS